MVVWRLSRKTHVEQPLSGEGAQRYGGRWNHVGVPVVYTSESLSLAVLEYLVNLPISDLPRDLVSIQIRIPDELRQREIRVNALPPNWRRFPATEKLKNLGTQWAQEGTTPLLAVPSVVIPNERNYLLNPRHALALTIVVVSIEPFALDERLYGARKPARKK
jgi:RES domain-containing protein